MMGQSRAARLTKELASELSGDQGGEIQFCAGLQVRVAELLAENRLLRRAMTNLLDDKQMTYAIRVQRAREVLKE
jgi:hypothetical protein